MHTNGYRLTGLYNETEIPTHFAAMRSLIEAGGPTPEQYEWVHRWIHESANLISAGEMTKEDVLALWRGLGEEYGTETMQGFGLCKPHGYTGDFEMMDRIYLERVTASEKYARWDVFFHTQSAPKAVRNRKAFFRIPVRRSVV